MTLQGDGRRATGVATEDSEEGSGHHPLEPIKSFWGFIFCSGREPATAQQSRGRHGEAQAQHTNPAVCPFAKQADTPSSPPPSLQLGPYFI